MAFLVFYVWCSYGFPSVFCVMFPTSLVFPRVFCERFRMASPHRDTEMRCDPVVYPIETSLQFETTKDAVSGSPGFSCWWLNQPSWKICSSTWVHLPQIGVKINFWNHQEVFARKFMNLHKIPQSPWKTSKIESPNFVVFQRWSKF